jgi:hypothetical protein
VGAGEREIPVKDRTLGRTQGGASVERPAEEHQGRLIESDPIYSMTPFIPITKTSSREYDFYEVSYEAKIDERCIRKTWVITKKSLDCHCRGKRQGLTPKPALGH